MCCIYVYVRKNKNLMLESYKTQNKVVCENKHGGYLQDIWNTSMWLKT